MRNLSSQTFIPPHVWSSCKGQLRKSFEDGLLTLGCRRPNLLRQASSTIRAKHLLPIDPARTRFAPSPTGNLHLGSIRTALFNYLLAKRTKGQFLLRIEDTDQKRTVSGAEEQLCKDLRWAGLQWDEGPFVGGPYGPYRQSERTKTYRDHAAKLLESKHAYRCFCSPERLDTLNKTRHGKGLPLGYDRNCAHLSPDESDDRAHQGENHVVRLRAPDKYPPWHDFVYGNTGNAGDASRKDLIEDSVYEDLIMIKSDGHPTYHLANVVDDHLMKITHVIRGSEWMSSTPIHLALYKAFDWNPPIFGHVPLLVDEKNQKLSKRNLDTDVATFRDKQGIFPDALVNFAVLLGWSHQQKSDILPLRQVEEIFDLKFTKGNTVVSFAKLQFLQKRYATYYITEGGEQYQDMVKEVCTALRAICEDKHTSAVLGRRRLEDVVSLLLRVDSKAYTTAAAFARRNSNLFMPLLAKRSYDPVSPDIPLSSLRVAAALFLLVPDEMWIAEELRKNFAAIEPPVGVDGAGEPADHRKVWNRELYHFLRTSLTEEAHGPPLPDLMEVLGKDICHRRINIAVKKLLAQEQTGHMEKPNLESFAVAT